MHKLVLLVKPSEKYVEQLKELAPDWHIISNKENPYYAGQLYDAEIIVGWNNKAAEKCLKEGSSLKWVHSWGAGVNTMPLQELKERNIILTNASGVHAYPISETIIALMLDLTRQIHVCIRNQAKKEWTNTGMLPEVHRKTIGIIGVGAIGEETAWLAKAFGMKVLGIRRSGKSSPNVDVMYDMNGLNELVAQSDYVVNILPSTKETYKIMGAEQFDKMKNTAFYISVGRGETTDTDALINALREKRIAGAGLDVFEQEPLPKESPLWELDNLIITPHSSGATEFYEERAMDIFIANFKDYLKGMEPGINRVNLDLEY